MFSRHFLKPSVMSFIDITDEIGDVNVPDCFFISWKYIFCRVVNPKSSRFAVPWSSALPNGVILSTPRSNFKGSIVHVVPCA